MPQGVLGRMGQNHSDNMQTPVWPIRMLLNLLTPSINKVWEPACGKGNILRELDYHGIPYTGTDINMGDDFLTMEPVPEYDCIITNPPFSKKDQFLKRCYELGKPFALLLPLSALGGIKRQAMYKQYGMQALILPRRVDFEFPEGNFKKAPWFHSIFITNGFNFEKDLIFLG